MRRTEPGAVAGDPGGRGGDEPFAPYPPTPRPPSTQRRTAHHLVLDVGISLTPELAGMFSDSAEGVHLFLRYWCPGTRPRDTPPKQRQCIFPTAHRLNFFTCDGQRHGLWQREKAHLSFRRRNIFPVTVNGTVTAPEQVPVVLVAPPRAGIRGPHCQRRAQWPHTNVPPASEGKQRCGASADHRPAKALGETAADAGRTRTGRGVHDGIQRNGRGPDAGTAVSPSEAGAQCRLRVGWGGGRIHVSCRKNIMMICTSPSTSSTSSTSPSTKEHLAFHRALRLPPLTSPPPLRSAYRMLHLNSGGGRNLSPP
eukprot:gene24737-biopygen5954